VGDWKLHFPHDYRSIEGQPLATGGKPVAYKTKRTGVELYNLRKDIGEKTNLAEGEPAIVELLKQKADAMRARLGDSLTMQTGTEVRGPGKADEQSPPRANPGR
jgi:hypothetical protein